MTGNKAKAFYLLTVTLCILTVGYIVYGSAKHTMKELCEFQNTLEMNRLVTDLDKIKDCNHYTDSI